MLFACAKCGNRKKWSQPDRATPDCCGVEMGELHGIAVGNGVYTLYGDDGVIWSGSAFEAVQALADRLEAKPDGHAHEFEIGPGPQPCIKCDVPKDYCHPVEQRAELWKRKASAAWDLVHELARWIPRGEDEVYDRVTDFLDEGLNWLGGKAIECEGE